MTRALRALALVLLAACSGDTNDPPIEATDLRLRIVSGDQQVSPVTSEASAASPGATSSAARELLPEPLVVALVDAASGIPVTSMTVGGSGVTAPTLQVATVPENLIVRFRVVEEGCGEAFIGQALPDSGDVIDRWVKGTLATDCHMEVARLIDGEPFVDTTFVWHAEPGPVARVLAGDDLEQVTLQIGESVDLVALVVDDVPGGLIHGVWDAHDNLISDLSGRSFAWAISSRVEGDPNYLGNVPPASPVGTGSAAVIPDLEALGYHLTHTGVYAIWIWVWVDGVRSSTGAQAWVADPAALR